MVVRGTSLPDSVQLDLTGRPIGYFMVVADGVGGQGGGAEASSMTLQTLTHYVTESLNCYYGHSTDDEKAFIDQLLESVNEIHSAVIEGGQGGEGVEGMASTLTLAIVIWPKAYIVQVGDSRCYHLKDGELAQITRDQTVAQQLADEGVISPEQAQRSHLNHVLSSAIGGPEASPVVTVVPLQFSDSLLLCSDGLTKHIDDETIAAQLRSDASSEEICRKLVGAALDDGGTDNTTVVVGRSRRG
jgi:protein phosphatase